MMTNITIEPLSKETLDDAVRAAEKVFPYEDTLFNLTKPGYAFHVSLMSKVVKKCLTRLVGITSLNYFVALDGTEQENKRVVGFSGIYIYNKDEKEAVWGAWSGVDSGYRDRGIGKMLFRNTLEKGIETGKEYFRLYTTTHPNEDRAKEIYKKLGFQQFKEEDGKNGVRILYMQAKMEDLKRNMHLLE